MLIQANALHVPLVDQSVQCIVSSPPYWGLRDYNLPPLVWDGETTCEHEWGKELSKLQRGPVMDGSTLRGGSQRPESNDGAQTIQNGAFCLRCHAWCGALGLEPTLELYVHHLVEIFGEVRRVLKKDGTFWLNLSDSYSSANRATYRSGASDNKGHLVQNDMPRPRMPSGLKPKDLCLIPFRVALALQADGWYLRADIIWSKPNPMPESVTDRPTRSHEYLFLLTKCAKYYYNAAAIRTSAKSETTKMPDGWDTGPGTHGAFHRDGREKGKPAQPLPRPGGPGLIQTRKSAPTDERNGIRADKQRGHWRRHAGFNDRWDAMEKAEQQANGANARSVWTIPTAPFSGPHFATFPRGLVLPCVLAGSRPGDVILDPFCGTATVGLVCEATNRRFIGVDLSMHYLRLAQVRVEKKEAKLKTEGLPLFAQG